MGGLKKIPSEGGSGGKRGHSGMEHHVSTSEIKDAARVRRRLDDRAAIASEGDDLSTEIELIRAFVVREKRERYIALVSSPRRRQKFLDGLYHFDDFDPACAVPVEGDLDSAEGIFRELRRRGAGRDCYVISANDELDRMVMTLEAAIKKVIASAEGTIVFCLRSRLAYYEGEAPKNRFILDRGVPAAAG